VLAIVYFLPRGGGFNYIYDLNKPWPYGQLIATFDFPIYKDEAVVKKEQDSLKTHFQPYFIFNSTLAEKEIDEMIQAVDAKELPARYKFYLARALDHVYQTGIISNDDMNWLTGHRTLSLLVISDKVASARKTESIYTVKGAYQYVLNASPDIDRNVLQRCDLDNFVAPNLVMDKGKTRQAQKDMMDNYSWAVGFVQSGQKIVDRGELVSQQTYNILESMKKELVRRNETLSQKKLIVSGQLLFVTILMTCFILYLLLFRKDFFLKKKYMTLMLSSIIFYCIITSLMVSNNLFSVYIIPFALIPIILRVFLDSRTAFLTLLITVFICSITLKYPYEFILLQITAGLVSMYTLSELSERSQLLRVAVMVTITYIVTYFALELIMENDFTKFDLRMYKYFVINGIFLLFAYPLLFLLEKAFGFVSNVTLVELSNTNNHLLRQMSELAPGTFQHSIQVANLAAAAANEIGADSQLVRTGALYHDVGKIENPEFFIENQTDGANPHLHLSYEQSAQIVINHVTDGLRLADKHGLPSCIKDFIMTHHGCGKTKYFYISWKNDHPGEEPNDRVFTYPGPNPFSKETAILMMCDSVEAASHSLSEHTDESISEMVDRIIDGQVTDGAFEECPITFRDISKIKVLLKEKLRSIYHVRISYPKLIGTNV
jgi:putative nucleotidyltransferase with HDIG domain